MKSAARIAALVLIIIALSSIGLIDKATASLLQSPTNPGTTNLVSWWALDETSGARADAHGTNALTDNNTVGYAAGVQSNAASLISSNSESLSIADNASLSLHGTDFTMCAWAKMAADNAVMTIIGKYSSPNREYSFGYITDGPGHRFRLLVSPDGGSSGLASVSANNFGVPTVGNWYFVCGGYVVGSSQLSISVNAGTADTYNYSGGVYDGVAAFPIGKDAWGGNYWNGDIDEVLLYKKALTSDEISWLYNSGSGRRYCEVANNCPEYQTATAEANLTGTAGALTATYDAQLTGTAGALTATYYPMLTGTAAALTATQVFSDDLQTVIAGYRTQRAALTYTPTFTATSTLTGTPNPAAQFESAISYGDIARWNALACIATIGGLWALVWIVVTFLSKRRRT